MAESIKFEVSTANIFVYNSPYTISESNRYTILNRGQQFIAENFGDQNNDFWWVITGCTDKPDIIGKYVNRVMLLSGKNFNPVDNNAGYSGSSTIISGGVTGTTEAIRDGSGNPINHTSTGSVVTSTPTVVGETYVLDAGFFDEYVSNISSQSYLQSLESGLNIENLRGVLGMPHQFTPITDMRIDGSGDISSFGRVFTDKILKTLPLLLITPGIPTFMSGYSDSQKLSILNEFFGGSADSVYSSLTGEYSGKYYSLKYAYVDYFDYVNAMLRSAAVFLGIHKERVNGRQLENFNWLYDATDSKRSGIGKFLGPYAGSIAFYADCGTSINDSFSNGTTQSQLSSTLNSLSDTGRELNFLVGNVGSLVGLKVNALTGSEDLEKNMDNVRDAVDDLLGSGNIMSNILNKAQTILAGGRLIFPEIWSDSSFGRSYTCSMKLISPSGDKLSVYLNVLVPIYHLLAMALPRQSVQQAYFSPFLLRCYYKGLFNVDMGIMTNLSITKGAEAEWTVDGIPTVAEVQFEIKDLYEGMFMSRAKDSYASGLLSNITELDYIANSCGININDQEIMRTFRLWSVLKLQNSINDLVANGIFGNITQFFNQKLNDLFGVF